MWFSTFWYYFAKFWNKILFDCTFIFNFWYRNSRFNTVYKLYAFYELRPVFFIFFFLFYFIFCFNIRVVKKLFRLKLNSNNLVITLMARKKRSKQNYKTYDFVVGKVNKNNKIFVLEKLGSVSYSSKKISINFFRLIFWLQSKPILLGKCHRFMTKFIFKKWKE